MLLLKATQLKKYFFIFLVFLIFTFGINSTHADTNQAALYLENAQNSDGSWGTDPSTLYFETAEVVKTLYLLGRTGNTYQKGVNFLTHYVIGGVEDHARKIEAILPAGKDTTEDKNLVLASQNSNGGWGFAQEYESNVYHTALSLIGLKTAGFNDSGVISPAINFITSQQKANGSFGLSADHDSIYLTSLVILAFSKYSGTHSVGFTLSAAVNWLKSKQNLDGGFGEGGSTFFETGYAVVALYTFDPTSPEIQDAINYLLTHQDPNGSFADNIYLTAAAAQGLDAATIDTELFAGLNLFGYQVELPSGYTSQDMLVDLGSDAEVDKIQRYDNVTGVFETTLYNSGIPSGDVFDISSGEGYFVYMNNDKEASQIGRIMNVTIQLHPGLNAVTLTCSKEDCNSYDVLSVLGTPDEVSSIQKFDRESGSFQTTAYFGTQPSGVNFVIENGESYLIYMKVAKEIDLPITPAEADYVINKGGSVNDSRNFQGDPAVLDQTAYYTENQIGVPTFVTYITTGVSRISATDFQISFTIQVSVSAPEGIYEFQVEYGLLDSGSNPLGPLTNNVFDFRIEIVP